jgi:hypothetical protein
VIASGLLAALASIGGKWLAWRAGRLASTTPTSDPPEPADRGTEHPDMVEVALKLARATAHGGQQRAVDYPWADLDELQQLRLAVREAVCATPGGSRLRHVLPWLWSAASSGGDALTRTGYEIGYELRMSHYRSPIC